MGWIFPSEETMYFKVMHQGHGAEWCQRSNGLELYEVAGLASLIFNSEHKTVNRH